MIETEDAGIVALLDSLAADCIGQKLIGSIRDSVKIGLWDQTNFSQVRRSRRNGRTVYSISLRRQFRDIELMEELLHVYLNTGMPASLIHSRKLNLEVEAKLGWYIYCVSKGDIGFVGNYLGGPEGIECYNRLINCIQNDRLAYGEFYSAFSEAAGYLRVGYPGYSNEEDYPFSSTDLNINKLLDLIENCLTNNYLPTHNP